MAQVQEVEIKHIRDHYEAFIGNKFIVSGDTFREVMKELDNINYEEVL